MCIQTCPGYNSQAMSLSPISTAGDFQKRVVFGQTVEDKHLEFKAGYSWQDATKKDDAADELARDVAQFANTEGGTLLIGVGEGRLSDGRRVATQGPGVPDAALLVGWIEQAISNHLVPPTLTRRIEQFDIGGKIVVAVNVSPSIHLVAVWHRQPNRGIEYLYRTDHGKDWMNPDEVERHLMNGSRASRLAVRRVWDELGPDCKTRVLELVPPVHLSGVSERNRERPMRIDPGGTATRPVLSALHEHEVEIVMAKGPTIRVPYSLIVDAWTTVDRRPALALAVRVVVFDGKCHLEAL